MDQEPWIDSKEAASFLNKKADWLVANLRNLNIPHVKLGRCYRFKKSHLDKWLLEEVQNQPIQGKGIFGSNLRA